MLGNVVIFLTPAFSKSQDPLNIARDYRRESPEVDISFLEEDLLIEGFRRDIYLVHEVC